MHLLNRLGLNAHSLAGRVAVITGTARGIGAHAARALAEVGARVVMVDIAPHGVDLARTLQGEGLPAHFVHADVRDDASVARIVDEAQSRFGPIDILVNNAAHLRPGAILELPIDDWDDAYRTHVRAAVVLAKAVLPGMLERRSGVIVSLISLEGMPALAHYCASKMGLRSMMLSLAKELPPDSGVSVFSVVPGSVDTPLIQEIVEALSAKLGIPKADILATVSNNPGYPGLVPPEHTAAALAWFCAHAAQFHGQFLDGYLPLSKSGVIRIEPTAAPVAAGDQRVPNPELELAELVKTNRALERRIEERTRELVRTAAQLEAANEKLELASVTDPLTGLWNRRYIDSTIAAEIAESRRPGQRGLAVALVDVDHFKRVNDQYGHQAGDLVLQALARIMRDVLRADDKIARWGGEEFLVVMRNVTDLEMNTVTERLRVAIAQHRFDVGGGRTLHCTCSIGVAQFPKAVPDLPPPSWLQMVEVADRCLYAVKASGRNAWIRLAMNDPVIGADAGAVASNVVSLLEQGLVRAECGNLDPTAIRWPSAAVG